MARRMVSRHPPPPARTAAVDGAPSQRPRVRPCGRARRRLGPSQPPRRRRRPAAALLRGHDPRQTDAHPHTPTEGPPLPQTPQRQPLSAVAAAGRSSGADTADVPPLPHPHPQRRRPRIRRPQTAKQPHTPQHQDPQTRRPAADTPTPRPLGTPRQLRNARRRPRPQLPGTRQPALHPSHSRSRSHLEQRPLRPPVPTTPAQRPLGSRHTRTHLRTREPGSHNHRVRDDATDRVGKAP